MAVFLAGIYEPNRNRKIDRMINKKWRGMGTLDWHTKMVK